MSSAFRSTTKRTSIGAAAAADVDHDSRAASRSHRRSLSLSRFSRRVSTAGGNYETPARRGKFVNTHRGAEISLDDLALDIFESANRWRSANHSDGVGKDASSNSSSSSSQMRGRSVSRQLSDGGGGWSRYDGGGRVVQQDGVVQNRRRSISVARYHNSDTESEVEGIGVIKNRAYQKRSSIGSGVTRSLYKPDGSNQRQLPRRSMSSKDLLKLHDGYSSQSSALTDEEPRNTGFRRNGSERTIRTVNAEKAEHPVGEDINGGLFTAMRKELRNAVEDIRLGLEQAMVHNNAANNSGIFESVSLLGKDGSKLDKFDKQKQDLSDEILMDGELDPEISKIVSDFLLDSENGSVVEKTRQAKKRSKDNRRMSTELIQEAEQYFEDFLSNVEDTDLSSFEGERSDCGSSVGGIKRSNKPITYLDKDTFQTPPKSSSTPIEMDGVVLPWLQWETANDTSPTSCNEKSDVASATASSNAPQDVNRTADRHRYHSVSSISCSSPSTRRDQYPRLDTKSESECIISVATHRAPYFDMDDYMDIARIEELTMESWRQLSRISNGSFHFSTPKFL